MKTFTIDSLNEISAWASALEASEASDPYFASEKDLDAVLLSSGAKPVEVWNALPGATPVKRFMDRKTGIARIWKQIQSLALVPPRTPAAPVKGDAERGRTVLLQMLKGKSFKQRTAEAKARNAAEGLPALPLAPVAADDAQRRAGTKQQRVVDLAKRPSGVTAAEIIAETGWAAKSVRGFMAGTVKGKLGLEVFSFQNGDGQRTYRVS